MFELLWNFLFILQIYKFSMSFLIIARNRNSILNFYKFYKYNL